MRPDRRRDMHMARKKSAPPAFIAAGRAALRHIHANRHLVPKCRAKAKTTGEQCRQFPMENGLCYYHGGRTPKGKDWHRPQWPKKSSPDAERKMVAHLRDLERREKQRLKRLARMTAEERASYDKWHRDRPLGTPGHRAAQRLARQQNAEMRARLAKAPAERPADPELAAIQDRIAELRALMAAQERPQAPIATAHAATERTHDELISPPSAEEPAPGSFDIFG